MNLTFKQYLKELMIDVDPEQDADDQLRTVRQTQLMAKNSPERVNRVQIQQARDQRAAAAKSTTPTASLEAKIAQKKEELFRLQQQLDAVKKKQVTAPVLNQTTT